MFDKLKSKIAEMSQQVVESVLVDDETAKERYNICLGCEKFHSTTKVCKICHCYLPGKTKIAGSSCPIKKWAAK